MRKGCPDQGYFDAPSLPEGAFGESAAEDADGRDARLAGRDSGVRRVADRDRFAPFDAKLLQRDFEEVRGRFGFIDVFGGRRDVYQIGDGRDVEVLLKFVFLRRGGDGDTETSLADAPQQVRDRRERPDERQVRRLEALAAPLF